MSWMKYTKDLPDIVVRSLAWIVLTTRRGLNRQQKTLTLDATCIEKALPSIQWALDNVAVDRSRKLIRIRLNRNMIQVAEWIGSDAVQISSDGKRVTIDIDKLPVDIELK